MRCPECQAAETKVIDSRPSEDGAAVRRRRICETCGARFTTYERCEQVLMVRKRSGAIEPFDAAKLTAGVGAALADRPASATQVSALVADVERLMRAKGATVDSEDIGKAVLERLRSVDEVAYLRFASVYKEFQGAEDFEREMAELESVTE
ncbi:MAG TPA: transcriptional regulator NrdR [Acidimicrobiia bacterium]|jgi:transcriptional repressor NrdR|nr:transcriptional regulator NrdR [Acidimicrobiia bacterium]